MIKISITLDKRTIKKDGTNPVQLLVLFPACLRRGIKHISVTPEEWTKMYRPNLRNEYLINLKKQIEDERKRAEDILIQLERTKRLTRENFIKLFDPNPKRKAKKQSEIVESKICKKNIYELFEEIIKTFDEVDSGTGENYGKALKSFRAFKPMLKYSELTPQFFKDYETHMLNSGRSLTLVGIYCRALRRAIKMAIQQKFIKEENYPFGKRTEGKYPIPKGNRSKRRALPDQILRKFIHFTLLEEEEYARDIVLFSFYCNGMNIRDVFHLQPDNITDKTISFTRRKTRRMTIESIRINIPLNVQIKNILEKWGTKKPFKHEYIFPLLNPLLSRDFKTTDPKTRTILFNKEAYRLIKNEIRRINRILKNIEKKLDSPVHLSTNIARYTWANFLDRNGAPLKYIQEGLGHTSPETTLHYLENLREEEKQEFNDMLERL